MSTHDPNALATALRASVHDEDRPYVKFWKAPDGGPAYSVHSPGSNVIDLTYFGSVALAIYKHTGGK